MTKSSLLAASGLIGLGILTYVAVQQDWLGGGAGADIAMDDDDIAGVVMGPNGPEAGAWVIAETTDLPTYFVRSVVTDDEGRYVLPDLPDAPRPTSARPPKSTRPSIGVRCSKSRPPTNFPARAMRAMASRRKSPTRASGSIS
jgi:hypothetical protein